MEDPWANAWGDSSKPVLPEPNTLWAIPAVAVLPANNEDLSTPSWPKGSVSGWSAEDPSADQIWSTTEISSTWDPTSTFEEVPETPQDSQTEAQESGSSLSVPFHEEQWTLPKPRPPTPHSISEPITSETLETTKVANLGPRSEDDEGCRAPQSPVSISKLITPSLSEDVDGFGSFETGQDNSEKESWTLTTSVLPPISSTGSPSWNSAWQVESEHGNNEQEDAWENARKQKEKRDRHPPQILSSILQQFEELSEDIWEDKGSSSAEVNVKLDFEMRSLNPVLTRLSPDDMTLPPTVPFTKTFTRKHMSESLKLTRHCISTRSSPMAMYLASKGSNSWEAAVKSRPIVTSDDVTPVGWKIADSSTQGELPLDDGKKKVGSIFSFFGRRTHNLSVDGSSKQPGSPAIISGVNPSKTLTPRTGSPAAVGPGSISEPFKPAVPEPSTVASEVDTKSPSSIQTTDAAKDELQPEATPSAVSRFIGRIVGRSKTQSIDSLALSADDLKFLADVPTSTDNDGLKAEDFTTLLETPLPPPPRPLAPPSRRESPLPKLPPPPGRPTQPRGSDDLFSLFDPTPIPTPAENPSTMNLSPDYVMPPRKAASFQSTISDAPPPNQMWTTFEEPVMKPTSSTHLSIDTIDLKKSSNGIKSGVLQIPNSSGSASIPVLAPFISTSTALPLKVDDDEFSDFLSSPPVQNSRFSSFSLDSLGSSRISTPSIKMTDTHRDDFVALGEVVDDLPAPRLPPSGTRSLAIVSTPYTQSESVHTRKKVSKKADHSRTLSLLESAAARGRWLAPPSPIPEALAPPPDRSTSSSKTVNHKLGMQTQQSLAMAAYSSDNEDPWRLPPPPSGTLLKPSVVPSTPVHPRLMPPSRAEFVAQSSISASSGLSAQDLSFFEGL